MSSPILLPPHFRPAPPPWKSIVSAVLAMLLAVFLLWVLDIAADKPKPAPEPLSKQLEVRRQWAAAELSSRLKEFAAARESALELDRQTADVWLEFADVKSDPDHEKGGREKGGVPTTKETQKKLDDLQIARKHIESLYQQNAPELAKLVASIDQMQAPSPADESAGLLSRLTNEKSVLNYVYRAVVIGLVGVFSVCGLYLLYFVARMVDIVPGVGDKLDALFKAGAESAKAPAVLLGTAVLTSVVSVGGVVAASNYVKDDGGAAKSVVTHQYNHQPSSEVSVLDMTSSTQNNIVNNKGQISSPLKVSLQEPLPPVSATLEAGATWASSVVRLERATDNLSSETDKLLRASKEFTIAAESLKSGMQNIKVVLPETADKPLRRQVEEDYANTQSSLKQLMKSNVIVDCKFQHALAAIYSVSVHTSRAEALDGKVTIDLPCPLK